MEPPKAVKSAGTHAARGPRTERCLRKRKITDKTLPASLGPEFEESALYQQLLDMERKLDWTMTRKLAEISDALGRTPTVCTMCQYLQSRACELNQRLQTTRTLRIFLSHSVSGQVWQDAVAPLQDGMDAESGQSIPAWTFRVEGRLLDSATSRQNKTPARKFSTFVKRLVVDWDQDPAFYAQSNMAEWQRGPGVAEQDGFEVKRRGDADVNVRVLIQLQHTPDRYALAPELSHVLDVQEDTRANIITALWNYIKINSLQDKVDRKLIRADADLRPVRNARDLSDASLTRRRSLARTRSVSTSCRSSSTAGCTRRRL